MGISFRHYLFLEDGSLRRIPQRIAGALPNGDDAVPEFAGTRQRAAYAVVESQDGRPVRILDAVGTYWTFDAEGRIDEDLQNRLVEHVDAGRNAARAKRARVVDLVPEIKRRELQQRDSWTLTAEDLDRIAADLWPGIHGPAPDIESVKGAKPKAPPLTADARDALDKINDHLSAIKNQFDHLTERALKGLAFEAVRSSLWEDEALWRGIAEEAKRRQAIRAAHRTGRGEWYAVLELARADGTYPYLWQVIAVEHEKCATRDRAVEAGRALMSDKGKWLAPDIELTVNIRSALEWRPEED